MMQARLLQYGRWLIALTILYFLIKHLCNSLVALEVEIIALQPLWLMVSLMLLLLYFGGLGMPWFFLYRSGSEKAVPFVSGWTFFQLSQLGRYLPGKVGQFVWMLSFSREFSIERPYAVLATCFQLVFQCSLGCILGALVLWRTEVTPILNNLLTSVEMSAKTGLICIGIVMLGGGVVFLYRPGIQETLRHLIKRGRAMFSMSKLLRVLGVYLLLWGLLGIAFFLFIKSLYSVDSSQLRVVTGIYAISWSIGFLSVITPSGLGVREGVLNMLLISVLPPATAMLVALLSRLWTLSGELAVTGVAFGLYWRQKTKSI